MRFLRWKIICFWLRFHLPLYSSIFINIPKPLFTLTLRARTKICKSHNKKIPFASTFLMLCDMRNEKASRKINRSEILERNPLLIFQLISEKLLRFRKRRDCYVKKFPADNQERKEEISIMDMKVLYKFSALKHWWNFLCFEIKNEDSSGEWDLGEFGNKKIVSALLSFTGIWKRRQCLFISI